MLSLASLSGPEPSDSLEQGWGANSASISMSRSSWYKEYGFYNKADLSLEPTSSVFSFLQFLQDSIPYRKIPMQIFHSWELWEAQ